MTVLNLQARYTQPVLLSLQTLNACQILDGTSICIYSPLPLLPPLSYIILPPFPRPLISPQILHLFGLYFIGRVLKYEKSLFHSLLLHYPLILHRFIPLQLPPKSYIFSDSDIGR